MCCCVRILFQNVEAVDAALFDSKLMRAGTIHEEIALQVVPGWMDLDANRSVGGYGKSNRFHMGAMVDH